MIGDRDVKLEFMDGVERTVPKVSSWHVKDGVLTLVKKWGGGTGFYGEEAPLGSYPLVNLRSYRWIES